MRTLLAALLLCSLPLLAQAKVYKCPDATGRLFLQSNPCPGSKEELPFYEPAPPVVAPTPVPRGPMKWVTTSGAVACSLSHWREEWDTAEAKAREYMVEQKRCLPVRAGLDVARLGQRYFDFRWSWPHKVVLYAPDKTAVEVYVGHNDLTEVPADTR